LLATVHAKVKGGGWRKMALPALAALRPIRAFDSRSMRSNIMSLVIALVLLMVGVICVAVVSGVGTTILSSLNSTGSITVPDYLTSVGSYISPVIAILGVAILIAAAVWILKLLIGVIPAFSKESEVE